jgi:hypothetical protein
MSRTITVNCPNPQCGWFQNIPVEFDDGPSYLDARENARRVAEAHQCGTAAGESSGRNVTSADEVIKTVDLGVASPSEVRAFKKEQAAQARQLREQRARG